ncbi:MAG: putative peptidoglycan glycosyltransferase FtsW [Eubacteriales bacterium]|nr:putative peptidoglycan glycosyltransferase FtsW [Eubacteriales bacterium]MDY4898509.1 putative peptidoglycan glycosyltransferase FtsW [Eubacteriales bacterium]
MMSEKNKNGSRNAAGRLIERLRRLRLSGPAVPSDEPEVGERVMVRGGIDIWFFLIVLALLCFGAVMSFSASAVYAQNKYGDSTYFLWRYILFAGIAILGTLPFVLFARPWFWRLFGVCSYGVSVILLLLVLVIGREGGGAQRWIDLGFMTIQPSEVAKMAVVLTLALYMSKHEQQIKSDITRVSFRYGVLNPAMIFGFICMLVALEKHISGLMIIGMIGISVMFMGGTRLKYIFLIIGAIGLAGVLLILVSDYAQDRVTTWLFLEQADPLGSAWQTWQGLYAIGSGGLFGKGLGNSMQKFGYVSEPQNDFVFTIICEELGFFGALLVVTLFGLLVWRGFRIAAKAPDRFSSLAVYGLTFKVALQTILNIAVVTNSMPNTGVSLPFFSSGGTSLAVQIFEMGIILSISRYSIQKR